MAGAGGFVGSAVAAKLEAECFEVVALSRSSAGAAASSAGGLKRIFWDLERGMLNPDDVEGFEAFVSLSGENIFGLWTSSKKKKILESRIKSAGILAKTISKLSKKPKVFICASATGYYGISSKTPCTENSPSGGGFLAEVCREWESAAKSAENFGVRTVNARFAPVLDFSGGMLSKLDTLAKWKVVPYFGAAEDSFSWISLEDLSRAILFCIRCGNIGGAVNFSAPSCPSKLEFSEKLAARRRAWVVARIPSVVGRFIGGEMAENLLCSDIAAVPGKLIESGFLFKHSDINSFFGDIADNNV